VTFNMQRAEALRTAIIGTSQTLRHYPEGDAKTLLTEHLALLQEAELIYLTDAFVGEGEEPPIFPDIKKLDEALGRVSLRKAFDEDPHADLRKTWRPGQRWQVRTLGGRNWGDFNGEPGWASNLEYRRHPDDVSAKQGWVNWAGGRVPVPLNTRIVVKHRSGEIYTTVAGRNYAVRWTHIGHGTDIVAYKVVK